MAGETLKGRWDVQGTDRGILLILRRGSEVTEALMRADDALSMAQSLYRAARWYETQRVMKAGSIVGPI